MPAGKTAGAKKQAPRARGSLSQDEILDGAQLLVERHGLAQLSMPTLAKHLKSGVTSIYWYFRSKDELVEALTDRVTREMYRSLPPVGDGPWDEELIAYFVVFRDLLEETPLYREVFAHRARLLFLRSAIGRSMLARLEDGLGLLTRAGLSSEQAAALINACSTYTRGFVILEHGMQEEVVDVVDTEPLHHIDPVRYPTLGQMSDFHQIMWLDDEQFRYGLRLLIDGIKRQHDI
ncbi:MAG TPA: TetR/AcrR family transcriptional regulator [Gemmatimonadales bacterium]|jgi:AcrR family transcriptional regulator|nr:TetR/AcrR family transcriptional regulator [Gemmatimonadales bacterium]